MDQPEVGDEVLDLAPLVEAGAGHQLVGYAVTDEGLFQGAGLGIGAVHHRDIGQAVFFGRGQALRLPHHHLGLFLLVVSLDEAHRLAGLILRPQLDALTGAIVGDDVGGHFEYLGRRSIILFEVVDGGVGEVALEVEDIAQVRRPPRVNGLIRVADHGDVAVVACQHFYQLVLHQVGVLELIHHDVQIPFLVTFEYLRFTLK